MFNILLGCTLFVIGQMLVWFQLNSQFVWEWWQDKPIPAVLLMGDVIPDISHTYMVFYEREHVCAKNTNLCFVIIFNCSDSAILENINEDEVKQKSHMC